MNSRIQLVAELAVFRYEVAHVVGGAGEGAVDFGDGCWGELDTVGSGLDVGFGISVGVCVVCSVGVGIRFGDDFSVGLVGMRHGSAGDCIGAVLKIGFVRDRHVSVCDYFGAVLSVGFVGNRHGCCPKSVHWFEYGMSVCKLAKRELEKRASLCRLPSSIIW